MARRLPSLARVPLPTVYPPHNVHTSSRRSLSVNSSKLTDRYPVFKRPPPSPRWQQGLGSGSKIPTAETGSVPLTWTKRLNINKIIPDDSSINPGHTIFTSPGATKTAVLDGLKTLAIPNDAGHAAVVFASPRHASWLTDTDFMADLVQKLHRTRPGAPPAFHVLAAVVDGLYPKTPGHEMQEGLSIQLGSLDSLLPGLWDEASDKTPENQTRSGEPGSESAHVSVALRKSAYRLNMHTVTLPLANTLFHNGRRTTLLASEWLVSTFGDKCMNLTRMTEKRSQKIDLPMPLSEETQRIHMRCPLVPITHPRKIVEGLGNILAKVDIEGEPSPASRELQVNIPRLLQLRHSRLNHDPASARIGVWALVIPEHLMNNDGDQRPTSLKPMSRNPSSFYSYICRGRLGTAIDKLAFEMTHALDRMAWQRSNVMGEILLQGGRLHQLLSGGGEWGAKASLLSLDPQTSYGVQSEDDKLDRFQRSFLGEAAADGATTRPGDFVQFFVEGDSEVSPEGSEHTKLTQPSAVLPRAAFGVGEFSKEDRTPERVDASSRENRKLIRLAPNHFGAFSAEGIYLDMKSDYARERRTKVNTPGTIIHHLPSTSKRVDPSLISKTRSMDDTDQ